MFNNDKKAVKVSIETKAGEQSQKAEFEFVEATELERVMMIHNIFSVMGVENDLSQMIEDYTKIGQAYHNFFKKIDPIEAPSTEVLSLKTTGGDASEIAEKLTEALKKDDSIHDVRYYSKNALAKEYDKALSKTDEEPEHYKTGIIKGKTSNEDRYQCRLKCECGFEKNRYIKKNEMTLYCPDCNKKHKVRWAKEGYLERDSWGNFFIAGKFKREDE